MRSLLTQAGFTDVKIEIKPNAAEFIKDWMPGSGAEKVITSAYIHALKPVGQTGFRDDVRAGLLSAEIKLPEAAAPVAQSGGGCGPSGCGPSTKPSAPACSSL